MNRPTVEERFWSKVGSRNEGECWPWTDYLTEKGYGYFRSARQYWRAHRWAYTHLVGPIPEGLVIDHLCRVRHCVNPAHMEPVTSRENTRRGIGHGMKTHCKRGHPYDAANTLIHKGWRECRTCIRALASARKRAAKLARAQIDRGVQLHLALDGVSRAEASS